MNLFRLTEWEQAVQMTQLEFYTDHELVTLEHKWVPSSEFMVHFHV